MVSAIDYVFFLDAYASEFTRTAQRWASDNHLVILAIKYNIQHCEVSHYVSISEVVYESHWILRRISVEINALIRISSLELENTISVAELLTCSFHEKYLGIQ